VDGKIPVNPALAESFRLLKSSYCHLVDSKRWSEVGALFTPEATLRFHDVSGQVTGSLTGREVADSFRARLDAASTCHRVFDPTFLEATGSWVDAVWPMEDVVIASDLSPGWLRSWHGHGRYREHYVLVEGQWRIDHLSLFRASMKYLSPEST
jgi:hypothetical protein